MSLAIDVDRVSAVLLIDGWHKVDFNKEDTSSFALDAYEYIQKNEGRDDEILHDGGADGICATGAAWSEKGSPIACPLTSILAVRIEPKKTASKSKKA